MYDFKSTFKSTIMPCHVGLAQDDSTLLASSVSAVVKKVLPSNCYFSLPKILNHTFQSVSIKSTFSTCLLFFHLFSYHVVCGKSFKEILSYEKCQEVKGFKEEMQWKWKIRGVKPCVCVCVFCRYVPPDQARAVSSIQASVSGSSASSTGSTPEVQPLKTLQLNKTPLRQVGPATAAESARQRRHGNVPSATSLPVWVLVVSCPVCLCVPVPRAQPPAGPQRRPGEEVRPALRSGRRYFRRSSDSSWPPLHQFCQFCTFSKPVG